MGFLDRMIKDGISKGVSKAVGDAVEKVVAPKATEYANKTAEKLDEVTQSTTQKTNEATGELTGVFANLQKAAEGYATEVSKDIKICPECGNPTSSEKTFCPTCGAKLPVETLAQGAVCPSCGKQNTIGTKFCVDCGAKLPSAVAEEKALNARDAEVMKQWDVDLPNYPKWNCGGTDFRLESGDDYFYFSAMFTDESLASNAVKQYRELLQQHDFRQAGEYPDPHHVYKMVNGVCYHVDTEHCFDGGNDMPTLNFNTGEPRGGFNYVKPEPKNKSTLKDLKDLFKL